MRVPLCDLQRQIAALQPELMAAVARVLSSGRFILGPEVDAWERQVEGYLKVRHAVGVGSGTDALWLTLRALGIGPGDAVLTTAYSFFATVSAIRLAGAEPVFADIEPGTFTLAPDGVRTILEGRSAVHRRLGIRPRAIKALLPVHLYGQPAEMAPLFAVAREHGLSVVEDAAQALGATYREREAGTLGDAGCFSLFPTKNLGAFGDAGLVVTASDELAARVRSLRAHGSRQHYVHEAIGTNSRLDALQAALLRVKLPHLEAWIAARRAHAAAYDAVLRDVPWLECPRRAPDRTHTFHQYTVRVRDRRRDGLQRFLGERGIETAVYYPLSLHLQPALRDLGYTAGDFPHAEQASQQLLSLPMFPELTADERFRVAAVIHEFPAEQLVVGRAPAREAGPPNGAGDGPGGGRAFFG